MSDMMLKTPTAMDAEIGSPKREPKSGDSGCLAQEIMGGYAVILPTPNAVEAEKYTKTYNKDSQMGRSLTAMAVNGLLPTPLAVSVRHSKRVSAAKAQGSVSFRSRLNGSPGSKDGRASQLNPLFVEEMMGYPLEWLTSPFLSGDGDGRP